MEINTLKCICNLCVCMGVRVTVRERERERIQSVIFFHSKLFLSVSAALQMFTIEFKF